MSLKKINLSFVFLFVAGAFLLFTSCEDDDVTDPDDDEEQQDDDDDDDDDPGDDHEDKPYEETIMLDCAIDEDMTLEPVEDVPVDYFVPCQGFANVNAGLTVEPGVVIMFAEGAGIEAREGGFLKVEGTDDQPVTLRGVNEDMPGEWLGVIYSSDNPENSIDHAIITGSGGDEDRNTALLGSSGQLALTNTTIEYSEFDGAHFNEDFEITEFASNSLINNERFGLSLFADHIGHLDDDSEYEDGNAEEFIWLNGGTVENDQEWIGLETPFLVENSFDVYAELNINHPNEFYFTSETEVEVREGYLNIQGTEGEGGLVTFRGEVETDGYWDGITFRTNHPENSLDFVSVQHGVRNIYFMEGQAAITNTHSHDAEEQGLEVNEDAEIIQFANNNFANNGDVPLKIHTQHIAALDGFSVYEDNSEQYIEVHSGVVKNDATWHSQSVPYLMKGGTPTGSRQRVEAEVTIEAGADFRIEDTYLETVSGEGGSFQAIGEPGNEITFTGRISEPGAPGAQWKGIRHRTQALSNFEHVVIANGEDYNIAAGDKGQINISNSEIRDSGGYGVSKLFTCDDDCNITLNNIDFSNNPDGDTDF